MYEKILVPLDGSELAEIALPYAEEFATQLGSEIVLTFVGRDGQKGDQLISAYLQRTAQSTEEEIAAYSRKLGTAPAPNVKLAVLAGHPAEKIIDYGDAENIDLIVMATHGRSGIKRWALGGVADKVVRATTRPVMLIRARGTYRRVEGRGMLHRILIPLDGSKEGEAVLPYIEGIAPRLKSEVILLQVLARGYGFLLDTVALTPDQMDADKDYATTYLNGIGSRLRNKEITVVTEARTSAQAAFRNPAEDILRFADEHQVDVVAMTTHGRSGVGRQVFGSVAEMVLREGTTHLMLVRSPGAQGER